MKLSKLLQSFVQNRYLYIYEAVIERALHENRSKDETRYYERHHIIPKSIAPEWSDLKANPWNGVLLTAREHFLAHRLLCLFTVGEQRNSALRAYHAVCFHTRRATGLKPTSLQYRKAREAAAEANTRPRGMSGPRFYDGTIEDFRAELQIMVTEGLSDPEIGSKYKVSPTAIWEWRRKLKIENRRSKLRNKNWLRDQYIVHRRSSGEIAKELGCTGSAVLQYLDTFGIPRRKGNTRFNGSYLENKEWLQEQIQKGTSITDMASQIGCSRPTVKMALKKLDLII